MDIFSFSDFFFRYCFPPFLSTLFPEGKGDRGLKPNESFFLSHYLQKEDNFLSLRFNTPKEKQTHFTSKALPILAASLWQGDLQNKHDMQCDTQLKITFPHFFPPMMTCRPFFARRIAQGASETEAYLLSEFVSPGAGASQKGLGWKAVWWLVLRQKKFLLIAHSFAGNKAIPLLQKQSTFKTIVSSEPILLHCTWQPKGQILIPLELV